MSDVPSTRRDPQLEEALRKAEDFSSWIDQHLPERAPGSLRSSLALRHFCLALDHRTAILMLAERGQFSSAYALLRPVYESTMRGLWISSVAKDGELPGLQNRPPKFDTMIRQLKRSSGIAQEMFHRVNAMAWDTFSDYAHGGPRQLSRWLTPDGVGPVHPEDEVARILPIADSLALLACSGVFFLAGVDAAPLQARMRIINGE